MQFPGYESRFYALRFRPDGRLLCVACGKLGKRVEILDLSSRQVVLSLSESHYRTADFSADSRLLVSTHQRSMRLWDVAAGTEIAKVTGEFWYRFAKFRPDGTNLFVVNRDGVENWLLEERSPSNHFMLALRRRLDLVPEASAILLSRDGRTLARAAGGGLDVFDTTT